MRNTQGNDLLKLCIQDYTEAIFQLGQTYYQYAYKRIVKESGLEKKEDVDKHTYNRSCTYAICVDFKKSQLKEEGQPVVDRAFDIMIDSIIHKIKNNENEYSQIINMEIWDTLKISHDRIGYYMFVDVV